MLQIDIQPDQVSKELQSALRAFGRGEMTKSQQQTVLAWIITDLTCSLSIDPPHLSEREAGYTAGQRRVGLNLMKLTNARLALPDD